MKELNSYIIEKLHLNKDIEIKGEDSIVDNILNWCDIHKPKYSEKNYETIKYQLDKWVRKNDVNVVDMYAEDSNQSKEHVSKLSKEIANKAHVLSFDDFYNLFIGSFPKGTDFNDILLYKSGNINIYGNEKGLSFQTENFSLLVIKLK